jgi:hypothetical protein
MLAVFGFAVVVWVTEALDYAISAVVIAALMAVLSGLSPNVMNPKSLYGAPPAASRWTAGFHHHSRRRDRYPPCVLCRPRGKFPLSLLSCINGGQSAPMPLCRALELEGNVDATELDAGS